LPQIQISGAPSLIQRVAARNSYTKECNARKVNSGHDPPPKPYFKDIVILSQKKTIVNKTRLSYFDIF